MTRPRARPRAHVAAREPAPGASAPSPAQHLEIAIRDLGERCQPDRGTALVELEDEAVERVRRPPRARRTRRLRRRRAPDARRSRGRRPGARLRGPRAARSSRGRSGSAPDRRRFAAAQRRAAPTRSGQGHERARKSRPATREGQLVAIVVEVPVEPGDDLGALVRVVRPARRDDSHAPPGERLALDRRMEDRRIDRVRDQARVDELDPEPRCASRL